MTQRVRRTGQEIRGVLESPIAKVFKAAQDTLSGTPPELACDVIDRLFIDRLVC